MPINAELRSAYLLAAQDPDRLQEITDNAIDYECYAAELAKASAEVAQAPYEPEETLQVPNLQPPYGELDYVLEAAIAGPYESIPKRLRGVEQNGKKRKRNSKDPAIRAVSELGHRCRECEVAPPKADASRGDLPSLLWQTEIWAKVKHRFRPKEIPYRNRSTPVPWTSEDWKEPTTKDT
ncbi:hypothetical protein NLG97_g1190 [Lecanicillium saksenae]|uniref:Uncharacterized protein n=1 Tax=Lecanicillium saksenae TaxID=468837 RepID=A0ACC1R6D9_9HYPO|nr:hypothetical protein NLG97_g1190 [Lecanicillium saksenae]